MKRLASLVLTLLLVFLASRALVRALPGDPIETLIAETGTSVPSDILRQELNLDRPFFEAIWVDLGRAAQGDWGKSILTRRSIGPLLKERSLSTLELTFLALMLGTLFSIVLGLAAAGWPRTRWGRWADRICTHYGAIAAALPTPWIGPMAIYCFAVLLPIFSLGGSVFLPAATLAFGFAGFWCRMIRQRVRESLLESGAAPAARSRGLSELRVILKYGLAPCSGALVAYFGTQLGGLMAGTFITEIIFNRQGMGMLFIDAVLARDYPVVEAAVFLGAAFTLAGNAAGDFARAWIDPRGQKA